MNTCTTLAMRLPQPETVARDNPHFLTPPVCLHVHELPEDHPDRRDFGHTHCARFGAYGRGEYSPEGFWVADYFYTPRTHARKNPYWKYTLMSTPQGWSLGAN